MTDYSTTMLAAVWTAFWLFVANEIEPMPGVWVAACAGAMISGFADRDRRLTVVIRHVLLALCVGVAASQIVPGLINIQNARVGKVFFAALFAQLFVSGVHNGNVFKTLVTPHPLADYPRPREIKFPVSKSSCACARDRRGVQSS